MKMKGSKYITCVCTHTGTRVPGKRWYHRCTQSYCYPGTVYYKYILLLYFKTQVHVCREKYLTFTFMLQVAGINTCCKYELLDFLFCYTQIDHYQFQLTIKKMGGTQSFFFSNSIPVFYPFSSSSLLLHFYFLFCYPLIIISSS